MSWLSENRHWLLFAGVVLTALGAVGLGLLGVVATISTLVTGGSVVAALGPFLLGAIGLGGLSVVFGIALAATLASRASSAASALSVPTSERAARVCRRVEGVVPPLARLRLSERFEPSVAERRAALTERYVDGKLTEAGLEAELAQLLDEDEAVRERLDTDTFERAEGEATDRETETTAERDGEASTDTEVETEP